MVKKALSGRVLPVTLAALLSLTAQNAAFGEKGGMLMECKIALETDSFAAEGPIPARHSFSDGENLSPALAWSNLPAGTKELALIVEDPDAPSSKPWVHWLIYKIPGDSSSLPQGIKAGPAVKEIRGALQGVNSGKVVGYQGPYPPKGSGLHHYYFTLYALDAPLEAKPGLDKEQLFSAMQRHIIGTGVLIGTYERQ